MGNRANVNKLISLLDRRKLATLRGERAANTRLLKIIYWLGRERSEGRDCEKYLDEALATYDDAPNHRNLVKAAVLENLGRVDTFGVSTKDIDRMRHGRNPEASKGKFLGETIEVDHIISIRDAPELSREIANLRLEPRSLNRKKSEKLEKSALALGRTFSKAGILSKDRLIALEAKANLGKAAATSTVGAVTSPGMAATAGSPAPAFAATGITDPRLIINHVGNLLAELQDWERRIDSIVENSNYVKMHTCELLDRAEVRHNHAVGQLSDNENALESQLNDTAKFHERVSQCQKKADRSIAAARKSHSNAQGVLGRWESQLANARSWLTRARARENEAVAKVGRCERAVSYAESTLSSAMSALNSARTRTEYVGKDNKGNAVYRPINTSSYEAAVSQARAELANCQHTLAIARDELRAATAEREAADRRVNACAQAVHLAGEARAVALSALDRAGKAEAATARAAEEQDRLKLIAERAGNAVAAQRAALEELKARLKDGRAFENNALSAFASAESNHNDARNHACKGRLETEVRLDKLRAFDAPVDFS